MKLLSDIIKDQVQHIISVDNKDQNIKDLKLQLMMEIDIFIKDHCQNMIFTTTKVIKNPYKKLESENFQYWLEGDNVILTNKYYRS